MDSLAGIRGYGHACAGNIICKDQRLVVPKQASGRKCGICTAKFSRAFAFRVGQHIRPGADGKSRVRGGYQPRGRCAAGLGTRLGSLRRTRRLALWLRSFCRRRKLRSGRGAARGHEILSLHVQRNLAATEACSGLERHSTRGRRRASCLFDTRRRISVCGFVRATCVASATIWSKGCPSYR